MKAKWTKEQKNAAAVLARSVGSSEASRRTGVSVWAIRKWRAHLRRQKEKGQDAAKLEAAEFAAVAAAVEAAGEYVVGRLKEHTDRLCTRLYKAMGMDTGESEAAAMLRIIRPEDGRQEEVGIRNSPETSGADGEQSGRMAQP